MATQKDLLKTAIVSGAVQATRVITNDYIDVSVSSDNYSTGQQTIVSPVDGYFSMAVSDTDGSNRQYMGLKIHADGVEQSATVNDSGLSYACHVPVKKGSNVTILTRGSSKVWWAHFIKVIVGGYKRYLKALACNRFGGSSWLRLKTTSETLRKQVAGSHSLQSRKSPSGKLRHRLTQDDGITYRRAMGILLCGLQELRLKPTQPRNMLSNFQQTLAAPLAARSVLVRRETLRHGVFGDQASLMEKFTSFRVWVASNNARMEVAA